MPLQRRPLQPVAHLRPAYRPYQPLTGKHRTRTISLQPLTPSTILRCDPHARMHRKTAIVPPPLHYRNRLPALSPLHQHPAAPSKSCSLVRLQHHHDIIVRIEMQPLHKKVNFYL